MKKILVLCGLLYVSSCVYAGEMNVADSRRKWVESFSSYSISYRDNSPKLVKTEEINEKSFKKDEIRTAFKGYSVLSDKTFVRSYYVSEAIKANSNVVFSNASAPYRYKRDEIKEIIGYSVIDGVKYALVGTDLEKFVMLVNNENHQVYDKTAMIKDDRLTLLKQDFISSNPDFRFEPIFNTKTEQGKPIKGFDIKYDGIRLDRMWFVYYDYATANAGGFKEYDFPNKPGLIRIGDVKIRVLAADNQRVDYMVLSD